MKTDDILKADVLDIIFDNRNKNYGAYSLRKFYHERLYKALSITFVIIALLALFVLFQKNKKILARPEELITVMGYVDPPGIKEKPKPPIVPEKPRPPAIQPPINSQLFISTIKIVGENVKSTKLVTTLDNVVISNISNNPADGGKQVIHADLGPAIKTGNTKEPVKIDKTIPITNAEVPPGFPGGEDALIKFLQQNLQDPESLEEGEVVSVKIKFIVGYDGVLKGFETIQDGGSEFNNEVIRVLQQMPPWIPGKTAGENVSVYYTIPVKFVSRD